jgi:hypothetical protein
MEETPELLPMGVELAGLDEVKYEEPEESEVVDCPLLEEDGPEDMAELPPCPFPLDEACPEVMLDEPPCPLPPVEEA